MNSYPVRWKCRKCGNVQTDDFFETASVMCVYCNSRYEWCYVMSPREFEKATDAFEEYSQ